MTETPTGERWGEGEKVRRETREQAFSLLSPFSSLGFRDEVESDQVIA
ncbi:hypothetical protein BH18ACI3_BH18ACI3_19460 [soil metagenome]